MIRVRCLLGNREQFRLLSRGVGGLRGAFGGFLVVLAALFRRLILLCSHITLCILLALLESIGRQEREDEFLAESLHLLHVNADGDRLDVSSVSVGSCWLVNTHVSGSKSKSSL